MFGRLSNLFEKNNPIHEEDIIKKWMEIHKIIYPEAETNLITHQEKMKKNIEEKRITSVD